MFNISYDTWKTTIIGGFVKCRLWQRLQERNAFFFFFLTEILTGQRGAFQNMLPFFPFLLVVCVISRKRSSSKHLPNCRRAKRLVTSDRVILSKSVSRRDNRKYTTPLFFIVIPPLGAPLPEEWRLRTGGGGCLGCRPELTLKGSLDSTLQSSAEHINPDQLRFSSQAPGLTTKCYTSEKTDV